MDKFVTKSPVNSDEKSLRRKGNAYDKQYDAKKKKKKLSWLTEFPWLALDADLGIMKCKICCKKLGSSVVFYVRLGLLK